MKKKQPITEIKIHKTWSNPQEYVSQSLVFHEMENITRKGKFIEMMLKNLKTGFCLTLQLHVDLLGDMLGEIRFSG